MNEKLYVVKFFTKDANGDKRKYAYCTDAFTPDQAKATTAAAWLLVAKWVEQWTEQIHIEKVRLFKANDQYRANNFQMDLQTFTACVHTIDANGYVKRYEYDLAAETATAAIDYTRQDFMADPYFTPAEKQNFNVDKIITKKNNSIICGWQVVLGLTPAQKAVAV